MSVGILEGNEGYPDRFSPDSGVVEFIPDEPASFDVYRPGTTPEQLTRTLRAGQALTFLARRLAE